MLLKSLKKALTLAKLPDLKYDLSELNPVLSTESMELHYTKHHNAYINNYNLAMENFLSAESKKNPQEMLKQSKIITFNGGGHFNHSFYWANLSPINKNGGILPCENSDFGKLVKKSFGSFEKMIGEFNKKTGAIQGSGWGWLAFDEVNQSLCLAETANQDTLSQIGLKPLLTIDVWEHAYYVNYRNLRLEYLKDIWKIVDWKEVEDRFNKL